MMMAYEEMITPVCAGFMNGDAKLVMYEEILA
jgi:hypothetical protein